MQNLQNLIDKMAKMQQALEDSDLALDVAQSQADYWEKKSMELTSDNKSLKLRVEKFEGMERELKVYRETVGELSK